MEQTEKKSWEEEMREWAEEFNVEVLKLTEEDKRIYISVGFSGSYNLGRFGHRETNFFDVVGWAYGVNVGKGVVNNKHKRVNVLGSSIIEMVGAKEVYKLKCIEKAKELKRYFERELMFVDAKKKSEKNISNNLGEEFGIEEPVIKANEYQYKMSFNGFDVVISSEKVFDRLIVSYDNKIIVTKEMVEKLKEIFGTK